VFSSECIENILPCIFFFAQQKEVTIGTCSYSALHGCSWFVGRPDELRATSWVATSGYN